MDNRRQPDNFEQEQQERRVQLRRRQRRSLQKQLFGKETSRIPFPEPKRIVKRTILPRSQATFGTRSQPEPRQPRINSATPRRSTVPPLRSVPEIPPGQPTRMAHRSMLSQNSTSRDNPTQESRSGRDEQASGARKRLNPWQVQPPSTDRRQTPKSPDANKGKGRISTEVSPATRIRKRRYNNPAANGAVSGQPGQATGKRVNVAPSQTPRKVKRSPKRPLPPLVYIARLLILGIGIGAIAGTILSAIDPATHASVQGNQTNNNPVQESPQPLNQATPLALNQEILPLKSQIQTLVAQNSQLQPGVFIVDLDTGAYMDLGSQAILPAASTIKLPVLVALFQEVDAGKVRLDETLTLEKEMMATGSGDLQYKKAGTQFTVLELATKMIAISDNTATNMLIARLGGMEALTRQFRVWGLSATELRNPLPDVEGMNVTSPKELATLLAMINQGKLVSLPSRDRIFGIMQNNQINNLLPQGLGNGAIIAHKTGNIGSLLADVGLVNMPSGKSYIISVMVKRPFNDSSAQELIRQISQTAYTYFNQPLGSPSTSSMPSESTASGSATLALDNDPY